MADMTQAGGYGSLQLLRYQGLFHHIVKEHGSALQALSREQIAICIQAITMLLCVYFSVCIASNLSQVRLPDGLPGNKTIAQITHSVLSIVLRAKGKICKFKSPPAGRQALLLLICCLPSQITGVRGEPQNDGEIQNCMISAPNAWVMNNDALKALAGTVLAVMAVTTILAAIAGRMFGNIAPLVPTIPDAGPEVPAIPAAVDALPIIPLVEGDDIDDVLARAPTPTRLNSPLSWL